MEERSLSEEEKSPFAVDLEKFYRIDLPAHPSRLDKLQLWVRHYGLHCVAAYRFDRYARSLVRKNRLRGTPVLLAARVLTHAMHLLHHVEIGADIGPGFYLGHASTVYIGRTRIGRNFSATHNVSIGVGHQQGLRGVPVIGDNVWVGTGSVLSGAITIGNDVTIANGTMMSRDVPSGCLAGGNPGRVLGHDYDNSRLLRTVA